MLELKFFENPFLQLEIKPLNRTMLELKSAMEIGRVEYSPTLNRTMLELK